MKDQKPDPQDKASCCGKWGSSEFWERMMAWCGCRCEGAKEEEEPKAKE